MSLVFAYIHSYNCKVMPTNSDQLRPTQTNSQNTAPAISLLHLPKFDMRAMRSATAVSSTASVSRQVW